ncbi:MAG TPA: hypothetical protein VLZ77_08650 [Acidimicrobiales bacterium]|nr:hypothetical protein [Acidimicrobiales bacterium]
MRHRRLKVGVGVLLGLIWALACVEWLGLAIGLNQANLFWAGFVLALPLGAIALALWQRLARHGRTRPAKRPSLPY